MSAVQFRPWAFRGCSSMVEHQPSKLDTWVRFPSPAGNSINHLWFMLMCANGSVVEHRLAKARVASSNLVSRCIRSKKKAPECGLFSCHSYFALWNKCERPQHDRKITKVLKRYFAKMQGAFYIICNWLVTKTKKSKKYRR